MKASNDNIKLVLLKEYNQLRNDNKEMASFKRMKLFIKLNLLITIIILISDSKQTKAYYMMSNHPYQSSSLQSTHLVNPPHSLISLQNHQISQQQQQQQQTQAQSSSLDLSPSQVMINNLINNNGNIHQQQQPQAPSITPFSFNSNVQETHRSSVLCTISSGDLPVSISWLKDGQLLTPQLANEKRIIIKPDSDQSTLKFVSVKLEHAGNYTCLAKNRAGQTSHSAQLIVLGEPRWSRPPITDLIATTRGQTVIIDCLTTGWPRPDLTWLIKTPLQSEFETLAATGRISLAANGSLVIRNADKGDEANYLCKSYNGVGPGISWSTSLKVNVPAHFESNKLQSNYVRKQSQVQLRCDAQGDEPLTIEWFKNKQKLTSDTDQRYSIHSKLLKNGLISLLIIKQAQRQDNSLYECITSNHAGRDRLPIELIVQEEPDNIQEIQVSHTNTRSVTLIWNEPYDGRSQITNYMFQYKKIQDLNPKSELSSSSSSSSSLSSSSSSSSSSLMNNEFDIINNNNNNGDSSFDNLNSAIGSKQTIADDWQQAFRIQVPVPNQNNIQQNNSININNNSPIVRSFTIDKLDPSSKYVLRALAVNSIGQSKFSHPLEFTTEEEAPEMGPTNIKAIAINSTSVLVSWDAMPKSRLHGYYVSYRLANSSGGQNYIQRACILNELLQLNQGNTQTGTVSGNTNNINAQEYAVCMMSTNELRLETILHDLKRDTQYEITVNAFNSRGSGPNGNIVSCKTIEMEAPKAVKLHIRKESNESIFIEWQRDPNDQNPIDDYILFQEKNSASQEWIQFRLPGNQTQYKTPGLKCGTRYQFYIIAQNKVGKSRPSDVVSASTIGALPVIPTKTSLIKMINSTCLLLNLNSFQDDGCRIKTFTVQYRIEKSNGPNGSMLINSSNGLASQHQAMSAANQLGGKTMMADSSANIQATGSSDWITIRPRPSQTASSSPSSSSSSSSSQSSQSSSSSSSSSTGQTLSSQSHHHNHMNHHHNHMNHHHNLHQQVANHIMAHAPRASPGEEDRLEYLCNLNPVGEYTIHVAASNDVGRSEIEYTVLMSSDELRYSAIRELIELASSLPNFFAYIPSLIVFLLAGLFVCLVALILYTTVVKYYQKFVIIHNQIRASRRAKEDEKRRRKLNGSRSSTQKVDLWADEYDDEDEDGDDEDDDDEAQTYSSQSAASSSANLNANCKLNNPLVANNRHQYNGSSQRHANMSGSHYLSKISNSPFDTSSIDSRHCQGQKCSGGSCMSTASTESIGGRFQCLNSKQYVKMNEYTMLPTISGNLNQAVANDIYGTVGNGSPQNQQTNANNPLNRRTQLYYSTLRRTNMQTYMPRQPQPQQQQQQHQSQSHLAQEKQSPHHQSQPQPQQQLSHHHHHHPIRSQMLNQNGEIYGYYMAPKLSPNGSPLSQASSQQQQQDEVANSIFVPPQPIIYSAPNIRRPPVFL